MGCWVWRAACNTRMMCQLLSERLTSSVPLNIRGPRQSCGGLRKRWRGQGTVSFYSFYITVSFYYYFFKKNIKHSRKFPIHRLPVVNILRHWLLSIFVSVGRVLNEYQEVSAVQRLTLEQLYEGMERGYTPSHGIQTHTHTHTLTSSL